MPQLPLFALNTALAPGERRDVNVFERRYVILLRDLLRAGGEGEFAVVGIKVGHEVGTGAATALYDVGCAARLVDVRAADPGFAVTVLGTRRFRVDAREADAPTPYEQVHVTWLADRFGDPETLSRLADRLAYVLRAYAVHNDLDVDDLPRDPVALSYAVPDVVALDPHDAQRLLEARTVETRLRLGVSLARRELILQSELAALPGMLRLPPPCPN